MWKRSKWYGSQWYASRWYGASQAPSSGSGGDESTRHRKKARKRFKLSETVIQNDEEELLAIISYVSARF